MLSVADSAHKRVLQWPIDDYILHMVVRRGPVVSKRRQGLYAEARDITGLVFHMALVEASQLAEKYDTFGGDGLVGVWQLVGSNGFLKLVRPFECTSAKAVQAFLLEPISHVRARYEAEVGPLNKPDGKHDDSVVQSASGPGDLQ